MAHVEGAGTADATGVAIRKSQVPQRTTSQASDIAVPVVGALIEKIEG